MESAAARIAEALAVESQTQATKDGKKPFDPRRVKFTDAKIARAIDEYGAYDTTIIEVRHYLKGWTRVVKTNPAAGKGPEGVLLGKLVELEVRQGNRIGKVKGGSLFVGWIPSRKALCLIKKTKQPRSSNPVSGTTLAAHKRFHNAPAQKASVFEWPDAVGARTDVGRIVSLTYRIPKGMKSPEKNRYLWKHEFGDHGERGHGPVRGRGNYPTTLMPMLQKDAKGNLFIKRLPGNKFYVTDWLYW